MWFIICTICHGRNVFLPHAVFLNNTLTTKAFSSSPCASRQHHCHIGGKKQQGFVRITVRLFDIQLGQRKSFFSSEAVAILSCRKKWCGCLRLCCIEPDSRVGQVLTQGQWPALMTIDNNLSLFDFQPNSLLERGNHYPKTASNKWSGKSKGLIKQSGFNLDQNQFENSYQSAVCLLNACSVSSCWASFLLNFLLIIHASEIAWLEVTLSLSLWPSQFYGGFDGGFKRVAVDHKWLFWPFWLQ